MIIDIKNKKNKVGLEPRGVINHSRNWSCLIEAALK